MEYLMTYGWAILIIAVVLGVLFQMGIFNGSALTPKAAPGSCEVLRLAGQVSLEGECQGQLPQYSLLLPNSTRGFTVPMSSTMNSVYGGGSSWTVVAWFNEMYPVNSLTNEDLIGESAGCLSDLWIDNASSGNKYSIRVNAFFQPSGQSGVCTGSQGWNINTGLIPKDTWAFIAGGVSYTGSSPGNYVFMCYDAVCANIIVAPTSPPENYAQYGYYFGIGRKLCCQLNWQAQQGGELANVQLYNASLSQSEISALYKEGIGGAPIRIQNLVGWWPLNGDTKDYSGNGNNGGGPDPGSSFNGSWGSSYTPP